jgi:hypothetical protein
MQFIKLDVVDDHFEFERIGVSASDLIGRRTKLKINFSNLPAGDGSPIFMENGSVTNTSNLKCDFGTDSVTIGNCNLNADDATIGNLHCTEATFGNIALGDISCANLSVSDTGYIEHLTAPDITAANVHVTEDLSCANLLFGGSTGSNLWLVNGLTSANIDTNNLRVNFDASVANLKVSGISRIGDVTVANIDASGTLRVVGEVTLGNLKTGTFACSGANIGGELSCANIWSGGIGAFKQTETSIANMTFANINGCATIANLLVTAVSASNINCVGGHLTCANITCSNIQVTNITMTSLRTDSITANNLCVIDVVTCGNVLANNSITTTNLVASGNLTSTNVWVNSTTPSSNNHLGSKGYIDGIGYISAGAGISKTGSTISLDATIEPRITAVEGRCTAIELAAVALGLTVTGLSVAQGVANTNIQVLRDIVDNLAGTGDVYATQSNRLIFNNSKTLYMANSSIGNLSVGNLVVTNLTASNFALSSINVATATIGNLKNTNISAANIRTDLFACNDYLGTRSFINGLYWSMLNTAGATVLTHGLELDNIYAYLYTGDIDYNIIPGAGNVNIGTTVGATYKLNVNGSVAGNSLTVASLQCGTAMATSSTTSNIVATSITSSNIVATSITSSNIVATSITSSNIVATSVTSSNIRLIGNAASGYAPTVLDYYEDYTSSYSWTANGCTGGSIASATVNITRIGKSVTVSWDDLLGTTLLGTMNYVDSTTAIPARFRPSSSKTNTIRYEDNNQLIGVFYIDYSTGILRFYANFDWTARAMGGGTSCRFFSGSVSWSL